jgi:hypothetical protein
VCDLRPPPANRHTDNINAGNPTDIAHFVVARECIYIYMDTELFQIS